MNKEILERLINTGLDTGADFSEIFYEDKKEVNVAFTSSIISKCTIDTTKGVGIRLAKGKEIYYANTNDLEEDNLFDLTSKLAENFAEKRNLPNIQLQEEISPNYKEKVEIDLDELENLKSKLYIYDKFARSLDKRVVQVIISIFNGVQNVSIANSKGALAKDTRKRTRFTLKVIVKENERSEFATFSLGAFSGLDLIDDNKVYKKIEERVKDAIEKLSAKPCPGGVMPVVIANGFGGVIIHEACGHAMEATMVADGTSILSDKLNQAIASSKVTIIDDGTINNAWGSTYFDDEGNKTKKNILIKNGVLKRFLIDEINNRSMKQEITGSGRREDFTYVPTSRMNNTYLECGTDKVNDMIASIKYGLYAKTLGGGQVNPPTGDFTFTVLDAYMIRDGKIGEPVKGASLVGNTLEILKEIEMVGDDLELSAGSCGSVSGWVPVTVGQPTIKVAKILVGGENHD